MYQWAWLGAANQLREPLGTYEGYLSHIPYDTRLLSASEYLCTRERRFVLTACDRCGLVYSTTRGPEHMEEPTLATARVRRTEKKASGDQNQHGRA